MINAVVTKNGGSADEDGNNVRDDESLAAFL